MAGVYIGLESLSIYLNGVQCRLKDILDLFMDTGMGPGAYSVIELKMIDEILSENTQDRRRLFRGSSGYYEVQAAKNAGTKKIRRYAGKP